jgi:hypothetical protein
MKGNEGEKRGEKSIEWPVGFTQHCCWDGMTSAGVGVGMGVSYGGFVRCIFQGLISRVAARLNSRCQDFLVSSVRFVAAAVILSFVGDLLRCLDRP